MKVIIVNGRGGVGKDTFESFVAEIAAKNHKWTGKTSMVTFVKQIAERCGWFGGKELKDRKFLSDLKLALAEWNDIPYTSVKNFLKRADRDDTEFVFVDAREAEDIDRLKEDFNAITVLIERKGLLESYGNVADDNVYNYSYDYVIENNGTLDELKQSAETFYEDVLMTDRIIKLAEKMSSAGINGETK